MRKAIQILRSIQTNGKISKILVGSFEVSAKILIAFGKTYGVLARTLETFATF